jgi:hypothetical protein
MPLEATKSSYISDFPESVLREQWNYELVATWKALWHNAWHIFFKHVQICRQFNFFFSHLEEEMSFSKMLI